jgi:hypothetical protein
MLAESAVQQFLSASVPYEAIQDRFEFRHVT